MQQQTEKKMILISENSILEIEDRIEKLLEQIKSANARGNEGENVRNE